MLAANDAPVRERQTVAPKKHEHRHDDKPEMNTVP